MEFSVDKITIINDDRGYKKTICYVQNCSTTSLKIRVAISQKSDPVSLPFSSIENRSY